MALGDYLKADRLIKLPWYQKALILTAASLVIIIFYFFTLDRSYKNKITELKGSISQLDKQTTDLRTVERDLPKFEKQNTALKARLDQAMTKLPSKSQMDALLKEVTARAKTNAIDIINFERGTEQPQSLYVEVPVNMKMQGGFFPLLIFLDELARLERIVNIEGLSLRGDKNGQLDVTCTLVAYRFKEVAETPASETKKKGGVKKAAPAPEKETEK